MGDKGGVEGEGREREGKEKGEAAATTLRVCMLEKHFRTLAVLDFCLGQQGTTQKKEDNRNWVALKGGSFATL